MRQTLFPIEQQAETSDDYYTPKWVFDTLGVQFDLDVAAPPGGIPWVPATRHFSMADDGLAQPWEGRIWMNPPFSGVSPWINRFIIHGNGIALLPFSKSNWFAETWRSDGALVLMPIDLRFHRGDKMAPIFMPTFLYAFGDSNIEAIAKVGRLR